MPTDETKYTLVGALVAGIFGLVAKLVTSLVGVWKAKNQQSVDEQKRARENDASLEEIRNKGIIELLNDYRQQVVSLKTELLAQATRHAQAMQAAEEKHAALEDEHYRIMAELGKVQSALAVLRSRVDGE